ATLAEYYKQGGGKAPPKAEERKADFDEAFHTMQMYVKNKNDEQVYIQLHLSLGEFQESVHGRQSQLPHGGRGRGVTVGRGRGVTGGGGLHSVIHHHRPSPILPNQLPILHRHTHLHAIPQTIHLHHRPPLVIHQVTFLCITF
ncbi:hypothetical protein MKW92_000427, partial [Papaver armeniacum]